jgi:hypothetical protein
MRLFGTMLFAAVFFTGGAFFGDLRATYLSDKICDEGEVFVLGDRVNTDMAEVLRTADEQGFKPPTFKYSLKGEIPCCWMTVWNNTTDEPECWSWGPKEYQFKENCLMGSQL